MAALPPPVAEVRRAVRSALADEPPGALVLVACSGGPDSLALASQVAFVAPRAGLRAGLVTVDHDLQPGSADRAAAVARWATENHFDPVHVVRVDATNRGDGPEAAARAARYAALAAAAARFRATAVLLGHTRDDQAETVLLALVRGAGLRGLAAMPPRRDVDGVSLLRPLLAVPRASTEATCAALHLPTWTDPHNTDPRFTRSRLRSALPALTSVLGEAVVANLARTARLAAADADYLDALADAAFLEAASAAGVTDDEHDGVAGGAVRTATDVRPGSGFDPRVNSRVGLRVDVLTNLPGALRSRVLRRFALGLGAPAGALSAIHIDALEALVTAWHGQGPTALPGGIEVRRTNGLLIPRVPR